jgi:hypothetical protein
VIEVPVGEHDRHRVQAMLSDDLVQPVGHAHAGIDDQTLLAGAEGHDPTVGALSERRESSDEHQRTFRSGNCQPSQPAERLSEETVSRSSVLPPTATARFKLR